MSAVERLPGGDDDERWHLRLYVADTSPRSSRAIANLENLCEEYLPGRCEVEIIDLVQESSRARRDDIVAIPTLVRHSPGPPRKVIGDLSNVERVLAGLSLGPGAGG